MILISDEFIHMFWLISDENHIALSGKLCRAKFVASKIIDLSFYLRIVLELWNSFRIWREVSNRTYCFRLKWFIQTIISNEAYLNWMMINYTPKYFNFMDYEVIWIFWIRYFEYSNKKIPKVEKLPVWFR